MGKNIYNMVNNFQNNAASHSHPLFDPRSVEGTNNPSQMNFGQGGGSRAQSFGQSQPPASQNLQVTELTGQQAYTSTIQSNKAVVIDVFTHWCPPCKKIKPFFTQLPKRFTQIKFCQMDLDKNRFLGSQLGIQSIPTFLFIHNGNLIITF